MRKISIEFVKDQRWRFVWLITSILCLGLLIWLTWHSYQTSQENRDLNQQTQNARLLMPSKTVLATSKHDSRHASSLKAASLLQFDLNKVFSTIENIAEPSIRLINITFDASAGALRLEYELDSIEIAVALTEKLNSGYEIHPWQMESLSTPRPSNLNGISSTVAKTIGVWRCQIKNI